MGSCQYGVKNQGFVTAEIWLGDMYHLLKGTRKMSGWFGTYQSNTLIC
jgi:hypothetical protein